MNPLGAYFLGLATFPAILVVIGVTGLIAMNRASGKRRENTDRAIHSMPGVADPDKAETPPPAVPDATGDDRALPSSRIWCWSFDMLHRPSPAKGDFQQFVDSIKTAEVGPFGEEVAD